MTNNFNYISYGNRDMLEGEELDLSMSAGRMFEYTHTDIEKRLQKLTPTAMAFLDSLPTFVCTEVSRDGKSASMLIKFGRLSGTRFDGNEVRTRFTSTVNFGDVSFTGGVNEARRVFDASEFQLYRTHWAVQTKDYQDVLKRLQKLRPEFSDQIDELLAAAAAPELAQPPERERNIIGTASSVEGFLKLLYDQNDDLRENFFRGHSNTAYELTPSLLRKYPNGVWKHLPNEERLCKELLIAHYDEFQGDQYCFDRLVRMQHYGLPTRLLDISSNPLVALFFACDGDGSKLKHSGEVIIFRIKRDKVKYYDSDTVSCLSNLSQLTDVQKAEIKTNMDLDNFNKDKVIRQLLHFIKSEKSYFEPRIIPEHLRSIVCVKAKRTNTRIKSQSGAFLLYGHEAVLPESGSEDIEISRITIRNKTNILKQLDSININATTVYPSIDRTALRLSLQYQQREGA